MKNVALSLVLMLSGCASYQSNYAMNSQVSSEPLTDKVLTARVGDTVVRQGRYTTTRAIRVDTDVKVGLLGENHIHPGYYVMEGEDAKSEYFKPENSVNGGKITKSALADPIRGLQAYKARPRLCTVTVLNGQDCRDDVSFTRVERLVLDSTSRQQQLVYSGRRGNILTFGYVESANLLPRQSADGPVQHDLSLSNRVSYKGLSIEVVDATDDAITYRVVGSGGEAV